MRKLNLSKHTAKRNQILEAARACFIEKGFVATSIADICVAAKVSPGHLYHYFSGKEAIVDGMIELALAHVSRRMDRLARSADPMTALLRAIDHVKTRQRDGKHLMVLDILSTAGRNPAVGAIVQAHSRKLQAMLSEVLIQAQRRGKVDPGLDPLEAAAVIISLIDGANLMLVRGLARPDKTGVHLLKMLLERFLSPPRKA